MTLEVKPSHSRKDGSGKSKRKAGRPRGVPNADKKKLINMIQEKYPDWHPVVALADMAHDENLDDNIRFNATKEVASYVTPKLKSIEHSIDAELNQITVIKRVIVDND